MRRTEQPNSGAFLPDTGRVVIDSFELAMLIEPRLDDLARRAARGGDAKAWLGIASDLTHYVGRLAEQPELRSGVAWEACYGHLYGLFERASKKGFKR